MIIVLAGATGFIGSHVLKELINRGDSVILLKRTTSDISRIRDLLRFVVSYDIDITPIQEIFYNNMIDVVINLSGVYGRKGELPTEMVSSNLCFPLHMLEQAIKNNVKVYINTDSFYNNQYLKPKNMLPYILTKKHLTEWFPVLSKDINIINMKLHHVYGPDDNNTKFIPWLLQQHLENVETINLTEGQQCRDFIYIDDVVNGFLCVLKNMESQGIPEIGVQEYEVGTGQIITLRQFVEIFHDIFCKKRNENISQLNFGNLKYNDGELMDVQSHVDKLIHLGWSPRISIQEGISRLISSSLR
jgi:nucleoside-diphosphate-sugar epimerase